ncbi:LysM peptidoglycan-binding domain-containing protein [Pseudomonas syringae pv. actinidiae]|nr:LysM peptidoglycan-binding domain-containing protein [Pseudomonas syringae pv. actinidiae]
MAENIEMTQDQALDQLKLQLALKELDKRRMLDLFMSDLGIKDQVAPKDIFEDAAFEKFMFEFSKKGPETIIQKYPDIWEAVETNIHSQNLDEEFDGVGISHDQVSEDTLEFLKATKAFEAEFPDSERVSLKDRLWVAKDKILEVASSPEGKVAINAVMLGVALGTGSAGIMAGAKLAVAVSAMLMKNPAVAALAEKVQSKLVSHLETVGIPVGSIEKGLAVIKEKTAPVTDKPMFKRFAVPALMAAVAVGAFFMNGSVRIPSLDGVGDLASNALGKAADIATNPLAYAGELPGMAGQAVDSVAGMATDGLHGAKEALGSVHQFMDNHDPVSAVASRAHDSAEGLSEFWDKATGTHVGGVGDHAPVIASGDVPMVDGQTVAGVDPLPNQNWANNSFADGAENQTPSLVPNEPPVIDMDSPTVASVDVPRADQVAGAPSVDHASGVEKDIMARTDIDLSEKQALLAVNEAAGHAVAGTAAEHVVAKGESVWKITEKMLGHGASDHDIAVGVKSFIDANPHLASNPDLIFPGDKLVVPAGMGHSISTPDISAPQVADIKVGDLKLDDSGLRSFVPSNPEVRFPGQDSQVKELMGSLNQGADASELASHFDDKVLNALGPHTPEISFPVMTEIAPNASKFGDHLDNAAAVKMARDAARSGASGPGMG